MTAKGRLLARCSFCLKGNNEVATLVGGPGVYICDECVALCSQLVSTKPAVPERLMPWERADSLENILHALPTVAAAGAQLEEHLAEWVRRARSLGATWSRIGEALGTTRQSAWERFSGEE